MQYQRVSMPDGIVLLLLLLQAPLCLQLTTASSCAGALHPQSSPSGRSSMMAAHLTGMTTGE
jgi:hypothetical protein